MGLQPPENAPYKIAKTMTAPGVVAANITKMRAPATAARGVSMVKVPTRSDIAFGMVRPMIDAALRMAI